jgi:hypothetical protein
VTVAELEALFARAGPLQVCAPSAYVFIRAHPVCLSVCVHPRASTAAGSDAVLLTDSLRRSRR